MIDMVTWGGAQWVLVTLLVLGLVMPLANNGSKMTGIDWGARALIYAWLVAILAWGGFWA